ncbi:MAG: hypothetical protein AB7O93_07850, partial [Vicinamibacterales bacterium]
MPPRYAYWTILVDGGPTAFRAAEPDELLPTLKRLQVKHPGAEMRWFQKGRLWESRDDARDKLAAGYTVGPDGSLVPPSEEVRRTKSWRPGGEHRDPREKFQQAKKAKWDRFKKTVRSRSGHGRSGGDPEVFQPFEGDERPADAGDAKDAALDPEPIELPDSEVDEHREDDASEGPAADGPVPETARRSRGSSPGGKPAWRDRGPKAFDRGGDRPRGPKPEWRDRGPKPFARGGDRPRGPKPEWQDRGPKSFDRGGDRPRGPKPEWQDRGPKSFDRGGDRPRGPKPEWQDRGPKSFDRGGDRPRGPKPEWQDRGPKSFDRG